MGTIVYYDTLDPTHNMKSEFKNRLWSIDGYTKVELERIYPIHHPLDRTTTSKNLSKIRRWLERECEGEIIIKQHADGENLYVYAYFELTEDAIQYKLTWVGENG